MMREILFSLVDMVTKIEILPKNLKKKMDRNKVKDV